MVGSSRLVSGWSIEIAGKPHIQELKSQHYVQGWRIL